MPIPKNKAKPVPDLTRKKILIHGEPKAGKTTLAAAIPDAIFLATEPGLGSVEAMRWEDEKGNYVIDSWAKLMTATREAVESKRFRVVVLDTIDLCYELAREHICANHGEEYYTDGKLGYGKGTALINNEMRRYLMRLGALDMGVVLLGHTVMETVTTRTGDIQRAVPNLPEKARRPLLGMMDAILYVDFETEQQGDRRVAKRVLRTKPHPNWEAGDRSGRLPHTLPLDWAVLSEAYKTAGTSTPASVNAAAPA